MPSLLSCQNAPHMALVGGSRVRQAEKHAKIAVRRTLASSHVRRPEGLLRCGPVEPWDVDADMQLTTLAWMESSSKWAADTAYCSCFLKLLSGLGDEILRAGRSSPGVLLSETCREARLHVVPERLPRGKVSPPRAHGPDEHKEGRAGRAAVAGRREGERREAGGSSCEKRATAACGVREQQEIGGANEIGSSKSMQPTLKVLLVVGILNLTPFYTSA